MWPGSTVCTVRLEGFTGLHAAGFKYMALKQPLQPALRKGAASVVPWGIARSGNLPAIGNFFWPISAV